LQIKGRVFSKNAGQRLGSINLKKEWDAVLLVILDSEYETICIYEANRPEITDALLAPGSRARNECGALSVSKFKSIATKVWSRR
jgi:hypothetical protein